MAWISAAFFCLGAADTLLGDRLGLGSAFRQGFAAVVAARLQLEPASITGLVVTSANCIPTLLSLDTLEERGITLNTAYAVVAAYSVGDFLAFTLQFSPAHALPMMAGRLLSGLLAVVLCLKTTPKTTCPPNGFSTQEMYGSRHTMRTREAPVNTIL